MIKVYGIANCNTVKKALEWMKQHSLEFDFHDYKKLGITEKKLKDWSDHFGWESLLKKKGTTWKGLPEEVRDATDNKAAAIKLMMEKTSVIKRPIVEASGILLIQFDEARYKADLIK